MMQNNIQQVNVYKIQLENIMLAFDDVKFGKKLSAQLVGGIGKLENLIASGKIEAEKPTNTQNGKWFCNAAQVMQHIKNFRN